jgi:hypothetical protein
VQHTPDVLETNDPKFRCDPTVVLAAIKGDATALKYAASDLYEDVEFLRQAYKINPRILPLLSEGKQKQVAPAEDTTNPENPRQDLWGC